MKQVVKYCLLGLLSLFFSGIIGFQAYIDKELTSYVMEKNAPEKETTTPQCINLFQHIPVNYSSEGVLAVDIDHHSSNFKSYARLLNHLVNQKKTYQSDSSVKCYTFHPIPADQIAYYIYALKKIVI